MDSLDCYFYLDINEPEDTRLMQTFCVDCMYVLNFKEAYFWQGSTRGYGEYKITCNKCNKLIHEPEEE
jgi:hypothetical protein